MLERVAKTEIAGLMRQMGRDARAASRRLATADTAASAIKGG